jgi:hypothetical protein
VRLVPSGEGAEVWVADRVTGKTVIRRILVPPDAAGSDAIATGAVELLRASLMELHAPSPPPGELMASGRVRALALPTSSGPAATRKPPRLGLGVAAALEPGVRGLGPSGAAQLSVWARLFRGLGARVFATLTFAAADVAVPEGRVHVTGHLIGGEASWDLRAPERRFIPVVGLGGAAAWVQATGRGQAPYESRSSSAWVGGPYVHAGLGFAATAGLRLRADVIALVAVAPASVEVAGRDIGSWGQPALLLSLGVESMLAF